MYLLNFIKIFYYLDKYVIIFQSFYNKTIKIINQIRKNFLNN